MAKTPDTLQVKIVGLEPALDAMTKARERLQPQRERLIAMGWTPAMADKFFNEIAEVLLDEMFKGFQVETDREVG